MIGLARMAWRLAYRRAWGIEPETPFPWVPRMMHVGSAHGSYYEIIDRIARGDKP